MKKVWRSHKLIILIVFAFIIFIPLLVFGVAALNTQPGGYQSLHTKPSYLKDLSNLGLLAKCVTNTSTNDYFVPTKTLTEWNAFVANHPANTKIEGCCGDGYCNFFGNNTGPRESVVNTGTYSAYTVCTQDCDASTACGNGVCDTAYDTHLNCPSDCCGTATDCGTAGCQVTTTCSGNTQSCSVYWGSFACNSGTCSHSQAHPDMLWSSQPLVPIYQPKADRQLAPLNRGSAIRSNAHTSYYFNQASLQGSPLPVPPMEESLGSSFQISCSQVNKSLKEATREGSFVS